jgi:hypothetical protein
MNNDELNKAEEVLHDPLLKIRDAINEAILSIQTEFPYPEYTFEQQTRILLSLFICTTRSFIQTMPALTRSSAEEALHLGVDLARGPDVPVSRKDVN